jgi:hypothetical protein
MGEGLVVILMYTDIQEQKPEFETVGNYLKNQDKDEKTILKQLLGRSTCVD